MLKPLRQSSLAHRTASWKTLTLVLITATLGLAAFNLFASERPPSANIDWWQMAMTLLGGLALFLFGLDLMIKGLLAVAGKQMKHLLAKLTTNRVTAAFSGFLVTSIIQSSSVTTVLVVGFVSAGLMTLAQAAGVIIGANVGTTVTAQIIAFKITKFAYFMVAIGFFMQFAGKSNRIQSSGTLILGLGLIFLGMNLMSEGMYPLRSYPPFLELMQQMSSPLYGILIGFIFTALVQSSSATIGIVIVMASNGFLTLEAGIALIMGANIGTCVTALLATLGKSREALRTAIFHVLFNVFGVLIWLPFIPQLIELTLWITPSHYEGLSAMESLALNTPREIANANTLLNLSLMLLFLPLIPMLIWAVLKLVPILPEETSNRDIRPEYLEPTLIEVPDMALNAIHSEMELFGKKLLRLHRHIMSNLNRDSLKTLAYDDQTLQKLKNYHLEMLTYLGQISRSSLDNPQQQAYLRAMNTLLILEEILDTLEDALLEGSHKLFNDHLKVSPKMLGLLEALSKQVAKGLEHSIASLHDANQADKVIAIKPEIDHLVHETLKHQSALFNAQKERVQLFRREMQLVDGLKRLHTLSKRLARVQMDRDTKNLVSETQIEG